MFPKLGLEEEELKKKVEGEEGISRARRKEEGVGWLV